MDFTKGSVVHTYDLSSQIPSRFVCMFSMSWFGLGPTDPQGAGPDSYSSHWNVGSQGACVSSTQPNICGSDGQRNISSNYRPLAGIYSSSGRNQESLSRIDLMLSTIWCLGRCDNSNSSNLRDVCLNSTIADFIDIISDISSTSNYFINGKPLIYIYTYLGGNLLTSAEWLTIWSTVRQRVTLDFYTICTTTSLLTVFDAVAPWIDLAAWSLTNSSLPLYNRTIAWLKLVYGPILSSNISSGRVIMGGLAPGFDDFTKSWVACQIRTIPRHYDVIQAQLDYFASNSIRQLFIYTWDDWTEGSHFEPDVTNGTQFLRFLRRSITSFYSETQNTDGDSKLVSRWTNYPQLRNCTQINVTSIPSVDISCLTPISRNQGNCIYSFWIIFILLELCFLFNNMKRI